MAQGRRSTARDGLRNKLEGLALTHCRPVWAAVQAAPPLRRRLNRFLINNAIYKADTRPCPFSTMAPYTSWDSLTDRSYSARHLPPVEPTGPLPPESEVLELFRRPSGGERSSAKSTLLFAHFAQWFTDGFLRTSRANPLMNTSNHDIDLSPLYGLKRRSTDLTRERAGGRLKSQIVRGEEYPPFYFQGGTPKDEFRELPISCPPDIEEARLATLLAMGGERANVTVGYAALNTLFLREHNRICGLLTYAHPDWDDERLFQTARNTLIVLLIKIVIEEYINHITPYHYNFRLDRPVLGREGWYRQNWMSVEFSLLYRWHSLVPDRTRLGGREVPTPSTFFDNRPLLEAGLGPVLEDASLQPAGEIGVFNTPSFLMEAELASIRLARLAKLATYNDYREACKFPRVTSFDQISGDRAIQDKLRDLYRTVDRIEFYPGLFAEDVRENSAVAPLIGRFVGLDAFSQALTNPLLARRMCGEATFSYVGLAVIDETRSLSDIVHRNLAHGTGRYLISMTRTDRSSVPGGSAERHASVADSQEPARV